MLLRVSEFNEQVKKSAFPLRSGSSYLNGVEITEAAELCENIKKEQQIQMAVRDDFFVVLLSLSDQTLY